jgi:hypothetical protein
VCGCSCSCSCRDGNRRDKCCCCCSGTTPLSVSRSFGTSPKREFKNVGHGKIPVRFERASCQEHKLQCHVWRWHDRLVWQCRFAISHTTSSTAFARIPSDCDLNCRFVSPTVLCYSEPVCVFNNATVVHRPFGTDKTHLIAETITTLPNQVEPISMTAQYHPSREFSSISNSTLDTVTRTLQKFKECANQ